MKKKKLGEVLRERGHISPADLTDAIVDQQGKLIRLGELMLRRGLVSKQDLASVLAEVLHVPYVECETLEVKMDAVKLVPHELAKRWCALPVEILGTNKLVLAIAEPQNLQILDELRFSTGMEIVPRVAFRDEIELAIEKCYGDAEKAEMAIAEIAGAVADDRAIEFISANSLQENAGNVHEMQMELLQKSTPAVRMVASIIAAAAGKHASDVHIEPQATDTVVRFRVDGILRDYQRIPQSIQNSVISRIKILCSMDIAERTMPQNGRFLAKFSGRMAEVRVSTLPTQNGEKLVMRLLDSDAPFWDFETLGLSTPVSDGLQHLLGLPHGMILVTGPTKSGKSTTLYSLLNFLRKPALNIVTVEDPVEYAVPGLNQVQVNANSGLTFSACVRSVLRQDPNVIMIGEIRDKETAEAALKAASSGPVVLGGLHTNDSVSAITRLLDLGVPSSQIAESVTGILSQRLIRRLCACHKSVPATGEFVARLRGAGVAHLPEMENVPVGCESCDLTGYRGRVGVYELLVLNDSLSSAIRSGAHTDEIRKLAKKNGMTLMREYTLHHVREGMTTMEEVLRVIPFEPVASTYCTSCDSEISSAFLFCPFCGAKFDPGPSKSHKHPLAGQGVIRK